MALGKINVSGKKLVGNAATGDVLFGKTFSNKDSNTLVGTMTNKGVVTGSVGVGGVFTDNNTGYVTSISIAGPTLSGNAAASNVLSGKTFYSNSGTKKTGSMISRVAEESMSTTVDTNLGIFSMMPPVGYYDGSTSTTYAYLTDVYSITGLTTGVIKHGTNIMGINGSYDTEPTNPISAPAVLSGKIGWVNGAKITGTMPNNGAVTQSLAINGSYTIPAGYHSGTGKVSQTVTTKGAQTYTPSTTNQTVPSGRYLTGTQTVLGDANLVAGNIKNGVSIFGVIGSASIPGGTAGAAQILTGYTFINSAGVEVTGTMPNNGATTHSLAINGSFTIPEGYHSGTGVVSQSIATKTAQTYTPTTTAQTIASGQYLTGVQTIAGDINLVGSNIKSGATIFGVAGNSNVVDTSAGDAVASQVLSGKKVYVDGALVTGSMTNNGAVTQSLAINGTYTIPAGYHSGSGKVTQSITTKAAAIYTPGTSSQTISSGQYLSGTQTIKGDVDLVTGNIKSGVNIFGVDGKDSVVDTSSATATAVHIRSEFTAWVNGAKIVGSIPDKAAETFTPGTTKQTISSGQYLTGTQTISAVAGLSAGNIKTGAEVGGVTGTYKGVGTATAARVLTGYTFSTASLSGASGTMVDRGAITSTLTTQGGSYTIPSGYHSGTGKVTASFSNLSAGNVRNGVNVGGVVGTFNGPTTPTEQVFTSSGTFVVPSGVSVIKVTACGGGGGGGADYMSSANGGGGGGGGGADFIRDQQFAVTPGSSIAITVGNGGGRGDYGDNTIVGTLITLQGGYFGRDGKSESGGGSGGSGRGAGASGGAGAASYGAGIGGKGGDSTSSNGGAGGPARASGITKCGGAGGGGASLGAGGVGNGDAPVGGGGGGGNSGNGGDGYVKITWLV